MSTGTFISCGLTVLFFGMVLQTSGQKPAQYLRLGDEAMAAKRYPEAEAFYRQAYMQDSTQFETTCKLAEAERRVKDYRFALHLYEKAWAKDNGKLFPEGLFWLAMMQKQTGQYKEAERNFRKYAKKNKRKGDYYLAKSIQEAEACAWVLSYKQVEDSLKWSIVEKDINSPQSENAAFLRDSIFYFSRYENSQTASEWKMFRSDWKDSVALNPQGMKADVSGSLANLTFGSGSTVYFTRCDAELNCGIWQADWKEGRLTDFSELEALNVTEAATTMPHYAEINGVPHLFVASDRDGGEGKMDIWISEFQNGKWKRPYNAGQKINTQDDELSPFYSNGMLYFSSDWHAGFGGLDVFRSVGFPGAWGAPENMGRPVNSGQNDLFFSVFPSYYRCFVSSNREGGIAGEPYSYCCNDIYTGSFLPPPVSEIEAEFATLDELNRVLPVRLYFHNDEPNPDSWDTTTNLLYSEAYQSYMKMLDTYLRENIKGLSEVKKEDAELEVESFFRLKVEQGMKDLQLFESLLIKELEQGKHIQLSIRGFASPRAKSDYNENLTKRRIASLVNEMSRYQGGVFLPYIKGVSESGGRLSFRPMPFGEYQASTEVSDDLNNERASIFSLGARSERKIEIESVEIIPEPVIPVFRMDESFIDFGTIRQRNGIVRDTLFVFNDGNAEMVIDSVSASCGCTQPEMDRMVIPPGQRAELRVGFDPFGKRGQETKYVMIYVQGEEPRVLEIRAVVE